MILRFLALPGMEVRGRVQFQPCWVLDNHGHSGERSPGGWEAQVLQAVWAGQGRLRTCFMCMTLL